MNNRVRSLALFVFLLALFLSAPLYCGSYILEILIIALWLGFLGSCWNIVGGYAGQLSLGHGTFVGVGAYTSTLLLNIFGLSPWIGSFIGALLAAIIGLIVGFLCFRFRIRGIYFALITMAIAEIMKLWFEHTERFGATSGLFLKIIRGPSAFAFFQFQAKWPYYLVILGMVVIVLLICFLIEHSRMGFYLKAIRGDEDAARCLGVSAFKYKCVAMVISCFLIAFGGTFYAQYRMYIKPDLLMGIHFSVEMVIPTVIGGWGTIFGPILGALLLIPLAEFSRLLAEFIRNTFHVTGLKGFQLITYGFILILAIRFMPNGITGLFRNFKVKG